MIIETTELKSESIKQFKKWVMSEWDDGDTFDCYKENPQLPLSLMAYKDNKLVGGLSFTQYKNPEKNENAIWINAVYVDEDYRGLGIAKALIQRATKVISRTSTPFLYVYTDKPSLYTKIGWEIIEESNNNSVLKKKLLLNL